MRTVRTILTTSCSGRELQELLVRVRQYRDPVLPCTMTLSAATRMRAKRAGRAGTEAEGNAARWFGAACVEGLEGWLEPFGHGTNTPLLKAATGKKLAEVSAHMPVSAKSIINKKTRHSENSTNIYKEHTQPLTRKI